MYKNIYDSTEEIEVSFSVSDTSLYRLPFGRLFTSYEIWTGAGKTGTELTENVDFIVGGESARAGEIKGESVYSGFQITNSGYHSTTLYATILFVGTIVDTSSKNLVNVISKSADYTISDYTDEVIEVTTGASDVTITLPDLALWKGRKIWIYKVDDGAGQVIIESAGSDTITRADLTQVTLTSKGDRWGIEALSVWWDLFEGVESGVSGSSSWRRLATNIQKVRGTVNVSAPATGNYNIGTYGWSAYGNDYGSQGLHTLPVGFVGTNYSVTPIDNGSSVVLAAIPVSSTTFNMTATASMILRPTGIPVFYTAEGEWY